MSDVAALLDDGAWALAESQRAVAHSCRLQVATRELVLTYRPHRVRPISGGSRQIPTTDGLGPDDLRARVRLLVNPHETPKLFSGYSTAPGPCDICGGEIARGAHEFEIVFSALTFVLDRECFGLWQDEMVDIGKRSSEKARRGPVRGNGGGGRIRTGA